MRRASSGFREEAGPVTLSAGGVEHAPRLRRAERRPGSERDARRAPPRRVAIRGRAAHRWPPAMVPSTWSFMARTSSIQSHSRPQRRVAAPGETVVKRVGPTRSSATGPRTPRHELPGAGNAPGRSSLIRCAPSCELDLAYLLPLTGGVDLVGIADLALINVHRRRSTEASPEPYTEAPAARAGAATASPRGHRRHGAGRVDVGNPALGDVGRRAEGRRERSQDGKRRRAGRPGGL